MDNTLFHTIQQIFEQNLKETDDFVHPIRAFSEKAGVFYICEKNVDGTPEWKQLVLTDMIMILKKIHNQMITELLKWKTNNQCKFDDNANLSQTFNKAVIKLMNMTFIQDVAMSKIKHGLYNYLKADLKIMVEYD